MALILDVTGLAERALGNVRRQMTGFADVVLDSTTTPRETQQVVLVSGPHGERLAVPLSAVARLEEFPATKIEWTGTRPVIQYRDQILPLVDVLGLLDRQTAVGWDSVPTDKRVGTESQPTSDSSRMQVVVCTDGTRRVGLVVGRILDIVTDPLLVRSSSAREHVLFTAVVQRQVTEVMNVASLISASEAEMLVAGAKT